MIEVEVEEAQARLPLYLDRVNRGDIIIICKDRQPVAEIRAVNTLRIQPRPVGLAKGRFIVPPEFLAPLPDDLLAAFEGRGQ